MSYTMTMKPIPESDEEFDCMRNNRFSFVNGKQQFASFGVENVSNNDSHHPHQKLHEPDIVSLLQSYCTAKINKCPKYALNGGRCINRDNNNLNGLAKACSCFLHLILLQVGSLF